MSIEYNYLMDANGKRTNDLESASIREVDDLVTYLTDQLSEHKSYNAEFFTTGNKVLSAKNVHLFTLTENALTITGNAVAIVAPIDNYMQITDYTHSQIHHNIDIIINTRNGYLTLKEVQ